MEGKIIKCVKNRYSVLNKENELYYCKLKSSDRLKKGEFSNPIAVGDFVKFKVVENEKKGTIQQVLERKNYVVRQSVNLSYRSQILAANIDFAFLIVTIKDRYNGPKIKYIELKSISIRIVFIVSILL